jgi:hypothetical protein
MEWANDRKSGDLGICDAGVWEIWSSFQPEDRLEHHQQIKKVSTGARRKKG